MNTLDNILSGRSDSASEQKVEEQVSQSNAGETQQEMANGDGSDTQVGDAQKPEGEGGNRQTMVPHEALHAEKQKVKRYTDEVVDLRKSNEALQRQVAEVLQRIPVPKAEPQQAPDQFEDFQGATRHAVKPEIDTLRQAHIANSQIIAGLKWGDDKVAAADEAFGKAVQSGQIDPADYQKVIGSPNIYHAAVQWHQRQLARAEIGDDPAAFRAKVEAELREKITAEFQQGNQQQERPAPVLPSNLAGARNVGSRSGPAWSGPTPIADIFKR